MRLRSAARWTLVAITLLGGGCGSNAVEPSAPYELQPNAFVVEGAIADSVVVTTTTLRYPLSLAVDVALRHPGDVLIGAPSSDPASDDNPYGYLRKVVSIGIDGGELVVHTVPANLSEAFARLDVTLQGNAAGATPTATTAVHTKGDGSGSGWSKSFDVTLLSGSGAWATGTTGAPGDGAPGSLSVRADAAVSGRLGIHGEIGVDPQFSLTPKLLPPGGVAELQVDVTGSITLTAQVQGKGEVDAIYELPFRPKITITYPGVPIWATLDLRPSVECKATGEARATFLTGVKASLSGASVKLTCALGTGCDFKWKNPTLSKDIIGPSFDASADLSMQCWLRPRVDLLLYDLGGVYGAINPYVKGKLDYTSKSGCNAGVYWGVDARVGLMGQMPFGTATLLDKYQDFSVVSDQELWHNDPGSCSLRGGPDGSGPDDSTVIVSSTDGEKALTNHPSQLATDGESVFFSNDGSLPDCLDGSVMAAPLDGSSVPRILATGLARPSGIAYAGGFVYWADRGGCGEPSSIGLGSIMRAKADGSGLTTLVKGLDAPSRLVVDADSIYYTAESPLPFGRIERVALDGSGRTTVAYGLDEPASLIDAGDRLVWADHGSADDCGRIWTIKKKASPESALSLVACASGPFGIAYDASSSTVYYAELGDAAGGAVNAVAIDGSHQRTVTRSLDAPYALLQRAGILYVSTTSSILKIDPASGELASFVSGTSAPRSLIAVGPFHGQRGVAFTTTGTHYGSSPDLGDGEVRVKWDP